MSSLNGRRGSENRLLDWNVGLLCKEAWVRFHRGWRIMLAGVWLRCPSFRRATNKCYGENRNNAAAFRIDYQPAFE